ncbi:hypothetical protein [Psychrobacter sp. T6-3]|uniref:hypothetical protein n=1 Tax=Psychrobacter sp. T6-3 TaxID=3457449 RepID=UPI003FCFA9C8
MKDNRQGYPEEVEGKQDNEETSKALDGPVAPFRPDGHQESQDSADAKQPDKQPEVETRPADGKLSFDQIATPEWIEQQLDYAASSEAYHSGSGRTPNDPSVAKELLQRFRELTTRAGIREAEGRWNDMWVSFYNQKRPSEPTAKPTKKKRTGMAL